MTDDEADEDYIRLLQRAVKADDPKALRAERDRYRAALEQICEKGRNPIAERALGFGLCKPPCPPHLCRQLSAAEMCSHFSAPSHREKP